jgi:hypothetical protein
VPARDLAGGTNNVVCVIGDGAMSAGMAYEAMNNAAARSERLIVILNDNDMSIALPVGALSTYLARITSSGTYRICATSPSSAKRLPKYWMPRRAAEEMTRTYWTAARCSRSWVLLSRAHRWTRPQRVARCCAMFATRGRTDPGARRHQEGRAGLRRPRRPTTNITGQPLQRRDGPQVASSRTHRAIPACSARAD